MPFDAVQIRSLSGKLLSKHVKSRKAPDGATLSYVEGWHSIAEANRIFGYDAWDRQTMTLKCVWEGLRQGVHACSYIARVRVRVRTGDTMVCREGCGSGHGTGVIPGEAHESAIKEAETDAMKRALATFGNPFGLALYDRERRGVTGKRARRSEPGGFAWIVLGASGSVSGRFRVPGQFCAALRRLLEDARGLTELKALWERNWAAVQMLRENHPELMSERHKHFADILILLYRRRLKDFEAASRPEPKEAAPPSLGDPQAMNGKRRVDKAVLAIPEPKRQRSKDHLRRVGALSCLICGRSPCQAHHIRYAQPRAMGRKVSDEWTVPLCATHHRALHEAGDERAWWAKHGQDPLKQAERLWREFHRKNCSETRLTKEEYSHAPEPSGEAARDSFPHGSKDLRRDQPPIIPS
jgi:DNA recombination protein Rad52